MKACAQNTIARNCARYFFLILNKCQAEKLAAAINDDKYMYNLKLNKLFKHIQCPHTNSLMQFILVKICWAPVRYKKRYQNIWYFPYPNDVISMQLKFKKVLISNSKKGSLYRGSLPGFPLFFISLRMPCF